MTTPPPSASHPVSLLEDGQAALEWVARYLQRVEELPVLAQVEPGEIRSRLPASPPDEGEPFSAVLRDLDEVLLPGITHSASPQHDFCDQSSLPRLASRAPPAYRGCA